MFGPSSASILCVYEKRRLARLHLCTGMSEPWLLANVSSTNTLLAYILFCFTPNDVRKTKRELLDDWSIIFFFPEGCLTQTFSSALMGMSIVIIEIFFFCNSSIIFRIFITLLFLD